MSELRVCGVESPLSFLLCMGAELNAGKSNDNEHQRVVGYSTPKSGVS